MARKATDQVTPIGIDIGKNNFHPIGLDGAGNIVLRRKPSRSQVIVRLASLPPCLIGPVYSAASAQGSATPVSRASSAHRKSAIAPMPQPAKPASASAAGV